jgi:hypothetical protein
VTEGGAADSVEVVAARLRELGLDHPAIDPAETAADLADRIAASASLDVLVAAAGVSDPTAFDPSWPHEPQAWSERG